MASLEDRLKQQALALGQKLAASKLAGVLPLFPESSVIAPPFAW